MKKITEVGFSVSFGVLRVLVRGIWGGDELGYDTSIGE